MSDYSSSLPIRTEAAGDVAVKVVDGTITSRNLTVNADGSINITDNGSSLTVDANNLDIRDLSHSQDSLKVGDGTDFLAVNADGSVNITDNGGSITVDGSVTVSATDLDIRNLSASQDNVAISDGTDTLAVNADGSINSVVTATNLDIRDLSHTQDSVKVGDGTDFLAISADGSVAVNIRDESGTAFSSSNPLPVVMVESEGVEINDYSTASAVAAAGTSNHDYTVTAGKTLMLTQISASASGKMKIEVQVESGVATNSFSTRFVQFNSTANPNMEVSLREPIAVAAGVRVRVIRTNKDNQAQDLYSTISGHEV